MSGQSIHAEKQHHIDMKAGDIAADGADSGRSGAGEIVR